jgi:hypothetical protein
MNRALVIVRLVMVLALGIMVTAASGWAKNAKNKDSGAFSTTCLENDPNLSNGATIALAPAQLWPPKHQMADVTISMNLNADANSSIPVSFSITSITDDQVADDDAGGHGCGKKTSKQGLDWAPPGLTSDNPLTINGSLQMATDSIVTPTGAVQLRRERCGRDGSRVYELEVTCCDNSNSQSPVCDAQPEVLEVTVPHDRRHMSMQSSGETQSNGE